jgi:sugar phosphate isomerase/epimerase
MKSFLSRRQFVRAGGAVLAAAAVPAKAQQGNAGGQPARFRFGLNTGTLRGYKLALPEQIEVAARAGYDGIEPWVDDIDKFVDGGGSLAHLKRRCRDLGLEVYSAIGFAQWIVDDDAARAKGLEQLKRDMSRIAELGGSRIAAPPAGATAPGVILDFARMAERYRAILELGRALGVVPQLEIWGMSANLGNLADALAVAARAGHPAACILADVFHLYKGGSAPASLHLLARSAAHVFHMNDYPAVPDRAKVTDAQRIWPGDGVAPLKEMLGYLVANDCRLFLSLELFNSEYWKLPVAECARVGLEKMKAAVSAAGYA